MPEPIPLEIARFRKTLSEEFGLNPPPIKKSKGPENPVGIRIAWITDPHVNRTTVTNIKDICQKINKLDPSAVLISGDIATAPTLNDSLSLFRSELDAPIHFVLGNHDYWGSNIYDVRRNTRKFASSTNGLNWLDRAGVVELSPEIGLVGHGGWNDGKTGVSEVEYFAPIMTDYRLIEDFRDQERDEIKSRVEQLGQESADYIRSVLPLALSKYPLVVLLTHYPPFREAAPLFGPFYLPHMVNESAGEAIRDIMNRESQSSLLVLAGHTMMPLIKKLCRMSEPWLAQQVMEDLEL